MRGYFNIPEPSVDDDAAQYRQFIYDQTHPKCDKCGEYITKKYPEYQGGVYCPDCVENYLDNNYIYFDEIEQ